MTNPAGTGVVAQSGEIRQLSDESSQQSQQSQPRALVVAQPSRIGLLRPIAAPAEVIESQEETRKLIEQALKKGRDYGLIKGTQKETLFKAGAERVVLAFGCYARFVVREKEVDHSIEIRYTKSKRVYNNAHEHDRSFRTEDVEGISFGLYRYVIECEIVLRETETIVGSFIGSASTMESKYIDRPRDCENTIIKMAEKRALVGAALTTFGLSDQFTQDVEDMPEEVRDRTANQASDVAGEKDDPSNDWMIPFGDHRGESIRQKNADGNYVMGDKEIAKLAKWCMSKRDAEDTPAGKKKFVDWLDGFEREIERRAAETAQNAEQQKGNATESSFESRYRTLFPIGELKGAKLDEVEKGEYIVSRQMLLEAQRWTIARLDAKDGTPDFVKPTNRAKIEQLLADIKAELTRRADAPPARIEDTAAQGEEGENRSHPTSAAASRAPERPQSNSASISQTSPSSITETTAKQTRQIQRKESFAVGDLRIGQLLAKWVGIEDENGHRWTLDEVEAEFAKVHPEFERSTPVAAAQSE